MKFIHTADWQIGKPYNRIADVEKRTILKNERLHAISRIAKLIEQEGAEFVLVAGDLFDSPTPSKPNVVSTLSAIGNLQVPVYVIPGNHDFGGPGSLWEQAFFVKEQKALAPNLHVLLKSEPVITESAVILPCPLLKRHESGNILGWLNDEKMLETLPVNLPRIVLAHGSVQGFDSSGVDEEEDEGAVNYLNLDSLKLEELDYIALGDWHGTKQINEKTWYSGTHETDRFPKGENKPGNILIVDTERNKKPQVQTEKTSGMHWHVVDDKVNSKEDVEALQSKIYELTENRTNKDLLHLTLHGALGLEDWEEYRNVLTSIKARLIRVKEYGKINVAPTEEEVFKLSEESGNQLTQRVAQRLIDKLAQHDEEQAEIASLALRELYISINNH